jgi:3,4-dihydroxy 2-butanone 4-phosphate synthase
MEANLHLGEFIEKIEQAITDLQNGKFILIYDDDRREGETDLVIASEFVTPESIKTMRKDGGGLIFLMISKEVANKLKLPFLADMYSDINEKYPILKELVPNDIPYDTKSSFSLYINHRETFTGITDIDRSLTMKRFAEMTKKTEKLNDGQATRFFGKEFRSPGHVPICVAAEKLLDERKGHTELVISIMKMAKLTPAGSGCEIIGDDGRALPKNKAKEYADKHGLVFLEGKAIVEAWKKWSK